MGTFQTQAMRAATRNRFDDLLDMVHILKKITLKGEKEFKMNRIYSLGAKFSSYRSQSFALLCLVYCKSRIAVWKKNTYFYQSQMHHCLQQKAKNRLPPSSCWQKRATSAIPEEFMKISIATVNLSIEAVHNALWFMAYMKVNK